MGKDSLNRILVQCEEAVRALDRLEEMFPGTIESAEKYLGIHSSQCQSCRGSGTELDYNEGYISCPTCNGTGKKVLDK